MNALGSIHSENKLCAKWLAFAFERSQIANAPMLTKCVCIVLFGEFMLLCAHSLYIYKAMLGCVNFAQFSTAKSYRLCSHSTQYISVRSRRIPALNITKGYRLCSMHAVERKLCGQTLALHARARQLFGECVQLIYCACTCFTI